MMNNYMKLICESDFHDYDIIHESAPNGSKILKLRGPMLMAETRNANGRIYRKSLLKPEVDRFIKEMVMQHRSICELEHSEESFINPDRACCLITELKEEGNIWTGTATVLAAEPGSGRYSTPCGQILASIITNGGRMGFSSRGCGTLSEDGSEVLEYSLAAIDCVCNPSIGLMCDGILESKNYIMTAKGDIAEVAYDRFEKQLKTIPTDTRDSYLKSAISKFINDVK